MDKKSLLVCLCAALLLAACAGDPNEAGVPDEKDFKNYSVNYIPPNIVADVYFYADVNLSEFFFYFDMDGQPGAEYLVKCRPGEFLVLKESATANGLYNDLKYSGTPTVSGAKYHLEFPLDALDPDFDPDFNTTFWFFAMEVGDRMPDSGAGELTIIG